jgi:hypothetical protein
MRPLLLLLLAAPLRANDLFEYQRAGTAAPFLRVGVGARAVAMGEAYTALADDAGAVYWNPAGLGDVQRRSTILVHSDYLESISFDYAAYAQRLGELGTIGASFHYLSAGDVRETDAAGVDQGSFKPYDLAVALSFAHRIGPRVSRPGDFELPARGLEWLEGYTFGASAKYVRSQIVAHAQTATFDLGLTSPWYYRGRVRWAVAAQNIGGVMKFDQEREVMPFAGKIGVAARFKTGFVAAIEGVVPRDTSPYAALGGEYRRSLGGSFSGAVRLGLNSRFVAEVTRAPGLSAGLGLSYLDFDLDYALLPAGSLGSAHQLSLGAKF